MGLLVFLPPLLKNVTPLFFFLVSGPLSPLAW